MGKLLIDTAASEAILTDSAQESMREAARLHRQNNAAEAVAAYRSIVARWPKLPDAWYNLAVLQRQMLLFDEALASYQRALACGIARPEEVHLNRAVIFSDFLRDYPAAARELEQALTLNPAYTPALLNLANLYEDLGKRAEASSLYARILTIEPRAFEALARFANVQPAGSVDGSLVNRLRAALGTAASMNDRASLGFALGRLLDAAGDYREAFKVYSAANQASLACAGPHVVPYNRAGQQAFVDAMIGTGSRLPRALAQNIPPQPIFIVGMFRSGSTLAEQLIAAIPGVAAGGELDFLPRLVSELMPFFETLETLSTGQQDGMSARYRAELMRVSASATYVTDKRPDNFLYLGLIKRLFPDAKIIHTTRDPLDNCLSIFFLHLEQQMSYALNLMDIGHFYREYRRLMAHWKCEFPGDIFDFNYDALIREPQIQMQRLCAFLGLEWQGQIPLVAARSAAIRTASTWQVREPLYTTSSGRARRYAEELKELRDYLAELA
jgi:tetratricopeptide (TPR) repeat protein